MFGLMRDMAQLLSVCTITYINILNSKARCAVIFRVFATWVNTFCLAKKVSFSFRKVHCRTQKYGGYHSSHAAATNSTLPNLEFLFMVNETIDRHTTDNSNGEFFL